MIFRKPDAFIIKHIKLIHGIILFCMLYLLMKMSNLSTFYARVVEVKSIVGESNLDNLFNTFVFLASFVSLGLILLIMILLIRKEKKFFFYLLSAILASLVLIFNVLAYSNIADMQKAVVDAPVYLAFNDISTILFYVQSVFVFIYLIKVTGFSIKDFSFGNNVIGLDLTEEDSEEVEFNFEIDSNEIKTARKRKLRNLKYIYLENRFKINLIVFLLICIITGFTIYYINNNQEVIYKQGDELVSTDYNLILKDTFVTNLNYKNEAKFDDSFFIIQLFDLKKNKTAEYQFDSHKIYIELNDQKYYPTENYTSEFVDFGNIYSNQKLSQDYVSYYLVYEIPYEFSTKEIYAGVVSNFDYVNNKYSFYKVKIDYEKLGNEPNEKKYKINDQMTIDSFGIHTDITISSFEIKEKYKLTYEYKLDNKIYKSVEYLTPEAKNNEEKVILKLKFQQKFKENEKSYSFYELLTLFGTIEYEIGDEVKESKFYSLLTPKKVKEENIYYVEISKDVLKGTNKNLKIAIREDIYKYSLEK